MNESESLRERNKITLSGLKPKAGNTERVNRVQHAPQIWP